MTEEQWIDYAHVFDMEEFIVKSASQRKCRLMVGACCRILGQCNFADLNDRCADGMVPIEELFKALDRPDILNHRNYRRSYKPYRVSPKSQLRDAYISAIQTDARSALSAVIRSGYGQIGSAATDFFRDIFGNPFRPITLDPRWRTASVLDLAQSIYDERAFDRMPILADALMDAGCNNDDILNHCRGDGTHVRGCWVVDLVLGKS